MTLYRVLRPLTTGHRPGDVVGGAEFKHLDALVAANALAEAKTPPLSEIPGWRLRSEKLAGTGVVTVRDFLEADKDRLRDIFGHKTTAQVTKWQNELKTWLGPGKKPKK